MSQEFLLKTPAAPTAPKLDNAKAANQSPKPENTDERSFSSALDKQVERRDTHHNGRADKAEIPKDKSTDKIQHEKADDQESGNILPEDDSVDNEVIASTLQQPELTEDTVDIEIDASLITELKSEIKPISTKLVPEEQLLAAKVVTAKVSQSTLEKPLAKDSKTTSVFGSSIIATKSENNDVDGLELDKKQSTTNLRSDIFHALSKNKSSESISLDNSAIKDHKALLSKLTDRAERSDRSPASFASALASTSSLSASSVQNSSTAQPVLAVQPAIHSEAWNRVLSSRVVWMAREGIQEASLKLNPANLGAVEVKLNMHNDQANVLFIAQSAATRDALEQALPKLRESFDENGMQLADAEVRDQEFEEADDNESADSKTDLQGVDQQSQLEDDNGHPINTEQEVEVGLSLYA